jgi:hypothetical protein
MISRSDFLEDLMMKAAHVEIASTMVASLDALLYIILNLLAPKGSTTIEISVADFESIVEHAQKRGIMLVIGERVDDRIILQWKENG